MANTKSNKDTVAKQPASADADAAANAAAANDNQQNVTTAAQDPTQGTHVAVHTIQYYDEAARTVVEVKAGQTFTPPEKDLESFTKAGAIREASESDIQRNTPAEQQGERVAGPVGYADNTSVNTAVYPGGVTNPNDIPANVQANTSAEPSVASDEALDRAPRTSVSGDR